MRSLPIPHQQSIISGWRVPQQDDLQFPPFLAHPSLHQRPHDLLRTLCPRNERQHFRVRFFSITYPSRARARQHWELMVFVPLRLNTCPHLQLHRHILPSPFLEFMDVLYQRKVPRERCVKDVRKP